jgi:hypothetical protein
MLQNEQDRLQEEQVRLHDDQYMLRLGTSRIGLSKSRTDCITIRNCLWRAAQAHDRQDKMQDWQGRLEVQDRLDEHERVQDVQEMV